jgi:Spy/CpxP family protein refolding chaperone
MKANLKAMVILFSIVLNVVFVGAFAFRQIPALIREEKAAQLMKPVFLGLDLSAEQLAGLNAEREAFIGELREMGLAVGKRQAELIDLLAALPPDQGAIDKKREEIRQLQTTTQDRVVAHFLRESSLLTPSQRARFFQIVKARIESSAQAYPPFLGSPGWCRPGGGNNE